MRQETQIKALQIVILHLGDSLTFAEIGRRMGFSRQCAYQRYHAALIMLSKRFNCIFSELLESMPTNTYRDLERIVIEYRLRNAREMLKSLTGKDM